MSKFFSKKFSGLTPYTPGEQPRDMQYVKLNTNESPFAPSEAVAAAVAEQSGKLQLYSDPENLALRTALAEKFSVNKENVIVSNGSDEVLNFAFMAFADSDSPLAFPDISYGFYPVFAELNNIPYTQIPLNEDFQIEVADYLAVGKTVVIANPNAPTGHFLPLSAIEEIVKSNKNNVVIIDEAYVDFGGESAVKLTNTYDNLLVIGTFSKSRSMAGARLGFAIGNKNLINDLNTIKYSTNPYNVNRMTEFAGVAALATDDYYMNNCQTIIKNREWTVSELEKLGFSVLPSKANFVFAKTAKIGGEELYLSLKSKGVLVRHFKNNRIKDFVRITIGTAEQMQVLTEKIIEIFKEKQV